MHPVAIGSYSLQDQNIEGALPPGTPSGRMRIRVSPQGNPGVRYLLCSVCVLHFGTWQSHRPFPICSVLGGCSHFPRLGFLGQGGGVGLRPGIACAYRTSVPFQRRSTLLVYSDQPARRLSREVARRNQRPQWSSGYFWVYSHLSEYGWWAQGLFRVSCDCFFSIGVSAIFFWPVTLKPHGS